MNKTNIFSVAQALVEEEQLANMFLAFSISVVPNSVFGRDTSFAVSRRSWALLLDLVGFTCSNSEDKGVRHQNIFRNINLDRQVSKFLRW